MCDRLTALGWSEIEVIDDDLGRSAAGGVQRAGFEQTVAQVCLGKVGASRSGRFVIFGGYRWWQNKFGINPNQPNGTFIGTLESTWLVGTAVKF